MKLVDLRKRIVGHFAISTNRLIKMDCDGVDDIKQLQIQKRCLIRECWRLRARLAELRAELKLARRGF
jgi:hypothetical protein